MNGGSESSALRRRIKQIVEKGYQPLGTSNQRIKEKQFKTELNKQTTENREESVEEEESRQTEGKMFNGCLFFVYQFLQ